MDNFGITAWLGFICCNRPFDERFDFSNKPTELYSCLSNENSISNLSAGGEQFGISSISNNLQQNGNVLTGTTNDHYTLEQQTNRNPSNSNHSSPNQQNPIYEYNLAELALLDNQRAQQYIQQQQNRHRQANTSAKQTDQQSQFSDTHLNEPHLSEGDKTPERPPPLPPLPSKHLLKRNNYYANIYSAPPQYTEPDFSDSLANHSLNYSNPPQYTPSVPIYGNQAINTNLQTDELATTSNLIHNSTVNKTLNNSNYKNHHHLPHHPNQNSLLTSMDGLRVQLNRTKKQMAAVANSASHLSASHLNQNGQSNATTAVSNVAQNLVSNLVANQPIRAPQIQRTDNMKVSLKGWLYRLEGAALKQWKRRWFVLGEYCLFYYKDSQEQKMIGSVLLPSYTVSTCNTNEDGIARKFSFKLEHHNLKTHYLAAECVETMHQWMRLITLSATMQINLANYEQLTDGTVSAALKAANINLNRPDSQDMMNMILNGRTSINNNENNKNFANAQEIDAIDQFNSTMCSNQTNASSSMNNSSFYNGQRRDSSNLDNQEDLNKLNDSGSESCGFTNYKSRRQSKTSELDASVNSNQMSAYNSVGLPNINNGNYSVYSSTSNSAVVHKNVTSNSQLNQQQLLNKMQQPIYAPPKRTSHYVNAPPKPKRHQPPQQTTTINNNLEQDFVQDPNMNVTYGTNSNKQLINQPDLVDANGFHHDLYSIPSSHRQQIPDENLYIQHRRQTLTRQNASDSGHITPIDDLMVNGQQPANFYDNNLQMKNRPKSSQEHQFDPNHQFNNNNGNFNDQIEQLNSPPYRPWSDFIFNQQAQRSQSTTPMSAKQNRLQSNSNNNNNNNNFVFNPTSINSNNITSANNLGTQSTSHAQLNNTFTKANRYDDEHAKKIFNTSHLNNLRTDSPDYMNIEYFKQQQQQQPKKLMQKLELDFEQQEKIYQSVLSKNARLEIENLKNEVAKQKQQLKEKQQQQAQNQSLKEDADDSKLSNLSNELSIEQDILPPPLNLTARSIQRRDSERSARLAEAEKNQLIDNNKLEKKIDSDEKAVENENSNTDITDDDSDEINLSPNPFTRSQFRRSFMNAVYTQKPHNVAASFHASHAYCGPIDNLDDNNLNDPITENNCENNDQNLEEKENDDKKINTEQMTMQQRKEQLQRLLHSDPVIEDKVDLDSESNQQKAIKPPRPSFKLTKDCFLKSEEKVRATPAIIVETPEKSQIFEEEDEELNKSISKKINQNIDQLNQVKKQLAFDLIEPTIVTTKPPRPNSLPTKKRKQQDIDIDNQIDENVEKVNVKDRIKVLEQQKNSLDSLISNNSSNLKETLPLKNIEPINLTNRLRSNSLTLIFDDQNEMNNHKPRQRHRSFSGQNLNSYTELNEKQLNNSLEKLNNLNYYKVDNDNNDKDKINEKQLLKDDQKDKLQINEDERDNGYLTMESKLSSNDEIDEHTSLSPLIEKSKVENNDDSKDKIQEEQTASNKIDEKVNFDEVFSSSKSPINSDEDADDEQSLRSQVNQTELGIVIEEEEDEEEEEEDNRKTVDDRFAIYSGLSTIKKAPPTYQNSRRIKNEAFKLTSALIEQQKNYKSNQLSPENLQDSQIATNSHIAEQLSNLQLNSIQQQFEQESIFKPQQIVSSSIINCGNNLVFVSNQVSPEMMDPNPAYETFDGVFYGQSCLPSNTDLNNVNSDVEKLKEQNEVKDKILISDNLSKNDENDNINIKNKLNEKSVLPSASNSHAPYYYSDLLSEEQKLELKTNEDRPELLSRCTGLNNSKNLGITSLQKLSNKKMNNSQERLADKKNEQVKDEKLENNNNNLENNNNNNNNNLENNNNNNNNNNLDDENKLETIKSQLNNEASELSNSITTIDKSNDNIELTNELSQSISNSTSRLNDNSYLVDDDPVYENVNRINYNQRSQSSIDLNVNFNSDSDNRTQTSYTNLINQADKNGQDDYLNENVLRRLSQNYIKQQQQQQQKHNLKPIEKLNNSSQQINNEMQDKEDKNAILNNQITPSKTNNSIKNSLNHHKTTPIHLRSPTVSGYATIDSEETVLINDDYKTQQSSDNSINTLNSNINQNTNKLSWKPNLISHSTSNLNNSNKLKPNNLLNYYENGSKNSLSSSSLTSSVQSLTTNQTNELNNLNQYYRQQSAPNLVNNLLNNHHNLLNNHGNNLNNNTEKCLANKQLNLHKNINKINNLLNAPTNGQDYVVYENAEAERTHLLALQKQLQQQQQLLLQQQEQLAQLQRQQQLKQQSYIRTEYYDNQPQLPAYSSSNSSLLNNSSILNESTIPFDHHLKNLQNISILQKDTPTNTTTNKNYHNYQNVFNNQDEP